MSFFYAPNPPNLSKKARPPPQDITAKEIAELMKIPRSTVQFRRTSSFELLKRFLEEKADDWKD